MGAAADYLGRIGARALVLGGSLVPGPIGVLSLKLADIGHRHRIGYGKRRLGTQPVDCTQFLSGEW